LFSAYDSLPTDGQLLHGLHFMLCSFAVLIGCLPLMMEKGSAEHKFAGLIYIPISFAALLLATFMAWREQSFVLFCFNVFCAYLLLSGWRAVHERDAPTAIDWAIPGTLFALAVAVGAHALLQDEGARSFYLLFFSLNGFYLAWRDWRHIHRRLHRRRNIVMFAGMSFGPPPVMEWLNRHVAGMVGSLMANLSVIVLTLLPLSLHWLWPATLMALGAWVAWKERRKKQRVRAVLAPVLKPGFGRTANGTKPVTVRKAA
jgi:hypothetical protein